eukprot:9466145-Pyramimonas_sp.AAC.1
MVASAEKRSNSARNVASSISFDGLNRIKCASWMARQLWHTDLTALDVCPLSPPSSASVDNTLRSSASHSASHLLSSVILALAVGPSSCRKVWPLSTHVATWDCCHSTPPPQHATHNLQRCPALGWDKRRLNKLSAFLNQRPV